MGKERRIIIFGEVGKGKSSSGNTLLGKKVFKADDAMVSVTNSCQQECAVSPDGTKCIVVDTPGLFDVDGNVAERALEIQKAVTELCPNPHVFLLVFDKSRFTDQDYKTWMIMKIACGEDVLEKTIILFTHGGEFSSEEAFESRWKSSEIFKQLAKMVNNRVYRIENLPQPRNGERKDNFWNHPLYEKMAELTNNWDSVYTPRYLEEHKKVLEEIRMSQNAKKEELILEACRKRVDKRKEDEAEREKRELRQRVEQLERERQIREEAIHEEQRRQKEENDRQLLGSLLSTAADFGIAFCASIVNAQQHRVVRQRRLVYYHGGYSDSDSD